MTKTIAILGSSRTKGNTSHLLDCIADKLTIEVIDLNSLNISPYDYEHNNLNDDFLPIIKYILSHDNIIFASPVYWYAMSAQMKIFFDRISSLLSIAELKELGREFRQKTGYVVATSATKQLDNSFLEVFTKTFNYLGMEYGGVIHAHCEEEFQLTEHQADIATFTNKFAH